MAGSCLKYAPVTFVLVSFASALPAETTNGAATEGRCDRVATRGDSPRAFVKSLRRGEVGCLAPGVYRTKRRDIKFARPRVTLTSLRGRRARLVGRVWIARRAHHVSIRNLDLDGRNARGLPSPTVNARDVLLRGNAIRNRSASCVIVGDDEYGHASRTVIKRNRIHHCGRLPATNHDHGIYVAHANGTVIRDNIIYSNADRGIQLYPDADGSIITGNVIDGNGQGIIFSGNGEGDVSEDNLVERNLITNSKLRHNVESSWASGPEGEGNVVRRNCVFGGVRDDGDGGIQSPADGFTAVDNLVADPLYVDRDGEDFRLEEDSPCASLGGRGDEGA